MANLPDWRQIPPISLQHHLRAEGGAINPDVILEVNCPTLDQHPITGEVLPARSFTGRVYIQPGLKLVVIE